MVENIKIFRRKFRFNENILLKNCLVTKDNEKLINFLKNYVENIETRMEQNQNLLLMGTVGLGKTYLMNAFKNELNRRKINRFSYKIQTVEIEVFDKLLKKVRIAKTIKKVDDYVVDNVKAKLVNLNDMITDIRKKYSGDKSDFNYKEDFDVLILDELGINFGSMDELKLLYDVVDYRYNSCRPTFLVSNYGEEIVKKILKSRIYDRLVNHRTTKIQLIGNSWR